jgi:MinD-like ATPase involved in chromosome partitioning or flagellar assembly/CheY-like chemotaxis protein
VVGVYCLIAAEPQAAEVIKRNLERSGRYPEWRFEVVTDAGELERWPEQPDVLVVSRFLPGKDPVALLKSLRGIFPAAHVVLLAGQASETQRAYVRAAERLGFYNVVTGRLPGDPPYTIFVALTRAREPELEGYAELEAEEVPSARSSPADPVRGWGDALAGPAVPAWGPGESPRGEREDPVRLFRGTRVVPADLRPVEEALQEGDLDAARERLAAVLAALDEKGAGRDGRMERVADRRGILVLTAANKGGVGKTTVAAAVATALARAGVPTVIVDLDFGSPDVAHLFGISGVPGVEALAGRQLRESVLRDLLVPVRNGPDVLPGPMDRSVPPLRAEEVARLLETLRGMYAVVVGDTPPEFWTKPWLAEAFAMADYVLAVVDQSVQSEQDTRDYAPYLLSMGVTPERIGIVLNRFSPKLHNPRTVERLFCAGFRKDVKELPRVVAVIPHDWEAYVREGYKGAVAGLEDARHAWHGLAERIAAMAGYGYRREALAGGRKPLFGLLKRG